MLTIQELIAEFHKIQREDDIKALVQRFGLQSAGKHSNGQVLCFFKGIIEGAAITITHRWYDRCKTFSVQPDGNKVMLEIDGMKPVEIGFFNDF
ncbi:MAG: hypothetical protein IPP36_01290 [Nitrosomonadales bacterium]|nr:hypothetical protein [Nitrosomonadales bacterium]